MTSRFVRGRIVASALVLIAATPAAALASQSAVAPRPIALAVTFTPRFAQPFERSPIVGELDLDVSPSGTIAGFYRPESDRSAIPLTGARAEGDAAFFDVGIGFESFHVDGRLAIAPGGSATLAGSARIGGSEYDVAAQPCVDERGVRSILCQ